METLNFELGNISIFSKLDCLKKREREKERKSNDRKILRSNNYLMKIPIDEKCDDKLKEKEIVITLVTFYYFVNKLFVLLLVRNVLKNTWMRLVFRLSPSRTAELNVAEQRHRRVYIIQFIPVLSFIKRILSYCIFFISIESFHNLFPVMK